MRDTCTYPIEAILPSPVRLSIRIIYTPLQGFFHSKLGAGRALFAPSRGGKRERYVGIYFL